MESPLLKDKALRPSLYSVGALSGLKLEAGAPKYEEFGLVKSKPCSHIIIFASLSIFAMNGYTSLSNFPTTAFIR